MLREAAAASQESVGHSHPQTHAALTHLAALLESKNDLDGECHADTVGHSRARHTIGHATLIRMLSYSCYSCCSSYYSPAAGSCHALFHAGSYAAHTHA